MRLGFTAVLGAGLLSACAATIDPEVRRGYEREIARLANRPTAVVADGCVIRDEIGGDYVLRGPSETAASVAAGQVRDYLLSQGFAVGVVSVPFICGSIETLEVDGVMADADADPERMRLPLVLDSRLDTDAAPRSALQHLLVSALNEKPHKRQKTVSYPRVLELADAEAELLKRELGTSDVWVVRASGGDVSAAKAIGLGTLVGVASLAISGGTFWSTSVLRDGNSFHAGLVNLDRRQLLWANALPTKAGDAGTGWQSETAAVLFEPFLGDQPRSVTVHAVQSIPPPSPPPPGMPVAAAPGHGAEVLLAVAPQPEIAKPMTTILLPLPESVVLTAPAELRSRPLENGEALALLAAGVSVRPVSSMDNAAGFWVFVRTQDGRQGWLRMERVKTAER